MPPRSSGGDGAKPNVGVLDHKEFAAHSGRRLTFIVSYSNREQHLAPFVKCITRFYVPVAGTDHLGSYALPGLAGSAAGGRGFLESLDVELRARMGIAVKRLVEHSYSKAVMEPLPAPSLIAIKNLSSKHSHP